jgi:hypothetical protein
MGFLNTAAFFVPRLINEIGIVRSFQNTNDHMVIDASPLAHEEMKQHQDLA